MDYRVLKRIFPLSLFMILSFFLVGFAMQQNTTEQGLYFVSMDFTGTQIKVGNNSMKLFIGDRKSKAPLKQKLDVEIVPWMPAHEHGTSALPIIKELGKGEYSVEQVNLSMPGLWEIYVRINKGKRGEDTAVFNVNVK
ncbi:MAG: FixH family protein [Nitrospirae bacterium]|nr:FixH family protein [Nitrospirota bacterium]